MLFMNGKKLTNEQDNYNKHHIKTGSQNIKNSQNISSLFIVVAAQIVNILLALQNFFHVNQTVTIV